MLILSIEKLQNVCYNEQEITIITFQLNFREKIKFRITKMLKDDYYG